MFIEWRTRTETASMLGLSYSALARATSDAEFGDRLVTAGLFPKVSYDPENDRPRYLLEDVLAVIEKRSDPAIAPKLRARQIK